MKAIQRTLTQAWTHRGPLARLLWPVSLLYGAVAALRRWLYGAGFLKTNRVSAKVIVVGNVVAGGAGKTPVAMALVKHLQSRGLQVGVVSRGYGRSARDCREVLASSAAQDTGDEPLLIQRATSAPVFVANDRVEAAQALLAKYPATRVIVSDDGLQHYALQRDLEICALDDRGLGNGFLLPAGPLREPWPRRSLQSSTTKAYPSGDLLWPPTQTLLLHTGLHPALNGGFRATRALATHAVRSDGSTAPLAGLRGQPLAAVAAIANPAQFFDMLREQGLTLAHTEALPDHYNFNSWLCNWDKGYILICTEKDAVKLWHTHPQALAVPLVVALDAAFLERVDAAMATSIATSITT